MHHRAANATTLGILGGGQLAMLLARAAQMRGVRVHLYLEKEEHAPAVELAQQIFMGDGWRDEATLLAFAQSCEVIALENEFVPVALLEKIAATTSVRFLPGLKAYGLFQNKAREKEHATSLGIPLAPWTRVKTLKNVRTWQQEHTRLVLKTCEGGYDGYGNLVVDKNTPDKEIERFLKQGDVLAEAFLDFTHELAIVVAKQDAKIVAFPVAETIQSRQICHYVLAPARLPEATLEKVRSYATALVEAAGDDGLFGVEFFLTTDGTVLYNEAAPRPHNSAHFTVDGCDISQFAMIVNLVLCVELTTPQLLSPVVGMLNLLGTHHGSPRLEPEEEFLALKDGSLCLYGKPWSRPGRKMGHFNLRGDSAPAILAQLQELQQRYQL
jgi:5-(carboxyamino)imidazole ribonucleotide synthase